MSTSGATFSDEQLANARLTAERWWKRGAAFDAAVKSSTSRILFPRARNAIERRAAAKAADDALWEGLDEKDQKRRLR